MTNLNTARIELLATHLEEIDRRDFNYGWNKCVAGHCLRLFRQHTGRRPRFAFSPGEEAADILGLTEYQAIQLFRRWPNFGIHVSPLWAARTLRLLAKTGKVSWRRAQFNLLLNVHAGLGAKLRRLFAGAPRMATETT